MTRLRQWLFITTALVLSLVPAASGVRAADSPVKTFVSIAPHAYFVEAIGGDAVEVEILVPSGQSPATYEPVPGQLARLAVADVLFMTGVPFEKRLLTKIAEGFDKLRVVKLHDGIRLRPIDREREHEHDHGGAGDPHVWLDPDLAARQAETIAATLAQIRPADSAFFYRNLDTLRQDIDSTFAAIKVLLTPVEGRAIYVFHPSFGYFVDAFGLRQVAIEHDGKEPSARQLAELIEEAGADRVKVLFVQPQFSRKQAEAVGEAVGARIVMLDPLSQDYMNNLMDMASKIRKALTEGEQ